MSYKLFDCVWIEASAGSGKTQSIINHMMKLILLNISTKKVVCFTLTNAAANEISHRIAKEVKRVAAMKYDEFKKYEVAISAFFIMNGRDAKDICEDFDGVDFDDVMMSKSESFDDGRNKSFYLFYLKSMEICENLRRSLFDLQKDKCESINLSNGDSGESLSLRNNIEFREGNLVNNLGNNSIFNIQTFHSFCLDLVNSAKRKNETSGSRSRNEGVDDARDSATRNDERERITIVTEIEREKLVFDAKEKVMNYLFELNLDRESLNENEGSEKYRGLQKNEKHVGDNHGVPEKYGFFCQLKKFSSFYADSNAGDDKNEGGGTGVSSRASDMTSKNTFRESENGFYFMNFIVSNLVEKKLLKSSSLVVSKFSIEHLMSYLEKNHQSIMSLLKNYSRCDTGKEMFSKNISSLSNFLEYKDVFMTQKNTLRKKIEKICENDKELAKEMNELMRLNNAIEKHKLQIKDVVEKVFLFYVNMEYSFAKKKINALDFDDLIFQAVNIVQNHELLANVLEYMQYRYFLIDESQDISPTQWSIIYKIFEELRYVYVHDVCIYVVGDQKQSIYKFQGANKEDYDFYKQKILNIVKSANGEVQEVNLNKCFRCDQKILNLVNKVFSQNNVFDLYEMHVSGKSDKNNNDDKSDKDSEVVLKLMDQRLSGLDLNGEVLIDERADGDDFKEFDSKDSALHNGVFLFPIVCHENCQSMYELLAKKVMCKISELVNGGYANYSDIMILVKNRNIFLKEMVKVLRKNNIPFRGVSGESLYDDNIVFGIIHFAHFVWNDKNDFALMVVLRRLLSVSWSVLHFLSVQSKNLKISIWNYIILLRDTLKNDLKFLESNVDEGAAAYDLEFDGSDSAEVNFGASVNESFYEMSNSELMNLVTDFVYSENVRLIQRIICSVNYCEPKEFFTMLVSFWKNEVDAGVRDTFLDLVNKLPKYECFFDAISELTKNCKRVTVDDNDFCHGNDALRILTIHKAKGLQSSIVFLPDTTTESSQRGSEFEMLYVALTRAQNALYVYGWGHEKGWYKMIKNALSDLNVKSKNC